MMIPKVRKEVVSKPLEFANAMVNDNGVFYARYLCEGAFPEAFLNHSLEIDSFWFWHVVASVEGSELQFKHASRILSK